MTPAAFSIVICTRHRRTLLQRSLVGVRRLDPACDDLVVVDNSDHADPEVRRLADSAGAHYVRVSRVGLSYARNAGALAAGGAIVAFFDDDAVPEPSWLGRHREVLERDASVSATMGRVLPDPPDGPVAEAYRAVGAEDLGPAPMRVDRTTPGWFVRTNFGGIGIGPNMAFRRELFKRGWRFRESLGPAHGIPGEEHYAFFTLVRDGHTIEYVPDAVVRHKVPLTLSALEARKRRVLRGAGAYALMLLIEEPGFRRELLAYALSGATSTRRRDWRIASAQAPYASRSDRLAAIACAPYDYARWRAAWRRQPIDPIGRVPGPLSSGST
jgi:glycosyltransferase involved in cell wall biosynthesis